MVFLRDIELKRRKKKEETSQKKEETQSKIDSVKVVITILSSLTPSLQKEIQAAEQWQRKVEYFRLNVFPFCVGLIVCVAGYYNLK